MHALEHNQGIARQTYPLTPLSLNLPHELILILITDCAFIPVGIGGKTVSSPSNTKGSD